VFDTVWTTKQVPSATGPSSSPMPMLLVIWKAKNVDNDD
jgi:hypothetical protein